MEAGKIDAIGLQKHYIVKRKTSETLFKKKNLPLNSYIHLHENRPSNISSLMCVSSSLSNHGVFIYLYYLPIGPPGITKPNQACNE